MKKVGKRSKEKNNNKEEYNPTWFACPFGVLADFNSLNLTSQQAKIFAYIVEQVNAHHPKARQNLTGVAITQQKFMEIAETKSKSYITKTIEHLVSLNLIFVEVGRGKTPSKYKVIDNRFLPLHLRKNRGK